MTCKGAEIIEEIAQIKKLLLELLQARRGQDDLRPFPVSPQRDAPRRAASLADFAAKREREKMRQSGN